MNAVSAVGAAAATLLRTDQREGVRVGGVQGGGCTTRKLQLHFGKTQRWNVLENKGDEYKLTPNSFYLVGSRYLFESIRLIMPFYNTLMHRLRRNTSAKIDYSAVCPVSINNSFCCNIQGIRSQVRATMY